MKKENYKMIRLSVLVLGLVVLTIVGTSFAYFTAIINGNEKANNVYVKSANLKATYSDGEEINTLNAVPGWSQDKTITITNTGDAPIIYSIKWTNVTNELTNMKYSLSSTSLGAQANVTEADAPKKDTNMVTNVTLGVGKEHTYKLTILFKDTGLPQDDEQGKNFSAKLEASAVQAK